MNPAGGATTANGMAMRCTIIAAVNKPEVLRDNLLASPGIRAGDQEVLLKQGYASAALAYNSAIDEASNDLLIFVHQDVYLPPAWFEELRAQIEQLDQAGTAWGVLGCFGTRRGAQRGFGCVYTNGLGAHGRWLERPERIDTLDEIVLVLRKSSGLRFDESLPHFHLYGTDICLAAQERGLPCFAVQCFCVHNTQEILVLPAEFYRCYRQVKRKWQARLPIRTSCITISRFDSEVWSRKAREWARQRLGRAGTPQRRLDDPRTVLAGLQTREK